MQKTKFRHKMWVGWGTPYRVPTNPTCAKKFDVGVQIETLVLFQTRILSKRNPPPQPVITPKSPGRVHLDQSGAQIRKASGMIGSTSEVASIRKNMSLLSDIVESLTKARALAALVASLSSESY